MRERGSVAVMIAIALPFLIGMVALGTEITMLLFKQRQMQSAASAAALGAATALQTGHPSNYKYEAYGVAASFGFINAGGSTVTVSNPPAAGPLKGSAGAVDVVITQAQTLILVKVLYSKPFSVSARAEATIGSGGGYCVLQVGNGGTVDIGNGAIANLPTCGLAANSSLTPGLSVYGGANLNAKSVSVVGTATTPNGGSINPSSALKTGQPPVSDPYADVVNPDVGDLAYFGCDYNGFNTNSWQPSWTLLPGVYCNGLSISNGATATLTGGVYFIDGGTFTLGGGAHVTGSGVTIVLTSSSGSNYANVDIGNGATVTLSAPTTGTTAGMIFYGDRRAGVATSSIFQGGAALNFTGVIYLPTQKLTWNNGSGNNGSTCTELIAGSIIVQGGASLQINCPAGVRSIGGSGSTLVE